MMTHAVIIPFRDRGTDPLRMANLLHVFDHWETEHHDRPWVVSDGREGMQLFNRSAAYNRGLSRIPADAYVFAESDILIDPGQVIDAICAAMLEPGLVVPFTQYRYLSDADSHAVRTGAKRPQDCTPESTMDDGRSIGAVNVVSRETMAQIGRWDTAFEGSWYDDNAMKIAFEKASGAATRWIDGPAYHLYHLPGWKGDHLTADDRAATARNRRRLALYRQATTPARIRDLTAGV